MSLDSRSVSPPPLAGIRVLSARTADHITPMARGQHEALEAAGAEIVDVPLVQTDRVLADTWSLTPEDLASFDWVCMTSRDAVDALATALATALAPALAGTGLSLTAVRFAVVGAAAHDAVISRGWQTTVDVPDIAVGVGVHTTAVVAAVAEEFLSRDDVAGTRMLLLTSEELSDALAHGLGTLGVTVHAVVVNRTVPAPGLAARMTALMPTVATKYGSVLLVTSPTAVDLLTEAIAPEKTRRFPTVCIGKPTARAARTAGFTVTIEMEYVNGPALVRRMASTMANVFANTKTNAVVNAQTLSDTPTEGHR